MRRHDESEHAGWGLSGEQHGRAERRGRVGYPEPGYDGGEEYQADRRDYRSGRRDHQAGRRDRPDRAGRPAGPADRGSIRSTGQTISAIISGVVVLVLVGGALVFYAKYRQFYDNIGRVDVSSDLNKIKEPKENPNALNILLIGSDSRAGVNGAIGGKDGIDGQRSDTVMVLHIAPGEHRAVVLSFPRDSVVPILQCSPEAGAGGQAEQPGEVEQINATFANGGPGCLWETIVKETGIPINDFVELTFIGFEKVIDDLGGVNVCLPAAVDDPLSGLKLPAGPHHVGGKLALAFWRTREDLGEGSDLQRIQRDQFLMAALLQGIEKKNMLRSPTEMESVISDISSNLTTDSGLDQSRMLAIAEGLHSLTSGSVQFIQVPTVAYPQNESWVQFSPEAPQLFSAIASDKTLPKAPPKKGAPAAPALRPAQVNVMVLNGSGQAGGAAEGATQLSQRGFNVVGSHNANNFNYGKSVGGYGGPADKAAAELVYSEFPAGTVEIVPNWPGATPGTIDAILGSSFTELSTSQPTSQSNLTQTYGGITGSTNICSDASAFSGPDGN